MKGRAFGVVFVVVVLAVGFSGYYQSAGNKQIEPGTTTTVPPLSGGSTGALQTSCYSGTPLANTSSASNVVSVYNVTAQFNSWQWNGTSFRVEGYQITATVYSNTATKVYLEPQVFLQVSKGQENETVSPANLGAWNGQSWPPDFPQGPVSLFNGSVTLQWVFTCDMSVLMEITIVK